jgi:uncharacterized membrane protein
MDAILTTLQRWDLHPVIDHFTVGLLVVGVLIDLVAGLAPSRIWIRYTALTLMILGAIAAGGSYFTGGMEADRVWNAMSEPAKAVLHRHAQLGTYMAVVFGVLAVWRILIEAIGFFGGSRSFYLIFAVVSAGVLLYIGSLGGQMVYEYGVGTALMSPPATPTPEATATAIPNESLPTVNVPTPTPIATMMTSAPIVSPLPTPTLPVMPPVPTASATPIAAH